eukprot:gene8757-10378_t
MLGDGNDLELDRCPAALQALAEFLQDDLMSAQWPEGADGIDATPSRSRFAAHLLLWLSHLLDSGRHYWFPNFARDKVVEHFVVHLISQEHYSLVPCYARHLRPSLLELTYTKFFDMLLERAPGDICKEQILSEAYYNLPAEGDGSVRSVVQKLLRSTREGALASLAELPEQGADQGRVERVEKAASKAVHAVEWAVGDHLTWLEATEHAVVLIRELVLGEKLELAWELVSEALPPKVLEPEFVLEGHAEELKLRAGTCLELQAWHTYLLLLHELDRSPHQPRAFNEQLIETVLNLDQPCDEHTRGWLLIESDEETLEYVKYRDAMDIRTEAAEPVTLMEEPSSEQNRTEPCQLQLIVTAPGAGTWGVASAAVDALQMALQAKAQEMGLLEASVQLRGSAESTEPGAMPDVLMEINLK